MRLYRQIAVFVVVSGLLGSTVAHGADSALQSGSSSKQLANAEKLFKQGKRYAQGDEVMQDNGEAAFYFRKAAELGNARAQLTLGLMYANGRGVKKDFDLAIYWIREAADLGQLSWHDPLVIEAVVWLQQASELDYAPAQHTIALMRASVQESEANSEQSVFLIKKTIRLSDAGTQPARYARRSKRLG